MIIYYHVIVKNNTVHSIIELVKYVFTIPGVTAFMTNRFCQDPLEKFFGQQRQRWKVNENPNVHHVLNTQTLRVVNGVCRDRVKAGNSRGSNNRRRKRFQIKYAPPKTQTCTQMTMDTQSHDTP